MRGGVALLAVFCLLTLQAYSFRPDDAGALSLKTEDTGTSVPEPPFGRKYLKKKKQKKKKLASKAADVIGGNAIDDCWMRGSSWRGDRMHLADCAVGFGANAVGGQGGNYYEVTDSSDDPVNPRPGTLRYGVTRLGPLWITFKTDMSIRLKAELLITSYKTIDARGAKVHIGLGGPCLTLQYVSHVIIHGLNLETCRPSSSGRVITSSEHTGFRGGSDGDAIVIFGSNDIWVDHCSLSDAADGLIDAIRGSTDITISNNYFAKHDKVMLFGHSDSYSADRNMKITVVYNHFQGCVQRMPRGRFGYFHVVNNEYESWEMYAIGGSSNPTFFSEGNRFIASKAKQVTKREKKGGGNWLWQSSGDLFLNGAYFVSSGKGDAAPRYSGRQGFSARPAVMVPQLTANAGSLNL